MSKPAAHSVETDKHVLRLLELQAKYSRKIEQMINIGIEFDKLVIDENLLHLALDMMGVPADTTRLYPELDSNATPPADFFCRDWFSDEFDRTVADGTPLQCLEYVKKVRMWVDNWNSSGGR